MTRRKSGRLEGVSGSVVEDQGRDVVEALDTVDGPATGLVPPIRPFWNVLTAAWRAAAAIGKEQEARSLRRRSAVDVTGK